MYKEPYIGMPIKLGNVDNHTNMCCDNLDGSSNNLNSMILNNLPLAMSYVPFQNWNKTYDLAIGLERGTIFPDLDLPFKGGMRR